MSHRSTRTRGLRRAAFTAATALLAALPLTTIAQEAYPARPITVVVPFAPGGIADLTARAVSESMARTLGQTIVVENKPSAGSIVASQAVANAKPDGYTLLLMSNGNAVSVGLFKKLPYDTVKDFTPISTLGFFDLGVFVRKESPFNTLQDLLRHAKDKPGDLKLGTIAVGSTQQLSAQLFKSTAGIDVLMVPYKASPAVLIALRTGEVDAAMEIVGPMLPHVKSGDVRALAVTGDRPNPALPAVPIAQKAGLPNYNVASWNALAAPAGTPPAVVERLNQAVRTALAAPEVRARLEPLGVRLDASTPQQAQDLLVSEIKRWGDVIRAAKIEPQ